MAKTTKKALSLALSVVLVFSLTIAFAMTITTYAALNIDGAKQIALDDAGLSSSEVFFSEAKADRQGFDIEFRSGQAEYDYEISKDGEILSVSYDSNKRVNGSRSLDAEAAKSAALSFAGAKASDVEKLRSEYDDNEYEISFTYGEKEYDVNVSAVDGSILEYDYEVVQSSGGIFAAISAFFQRIFAFFSGFFA